MARLNRLVVPGLTHHLLHRAANGGRLFVDKVDADLLVKALQRSSAEQAVEIHAYAVVESELQLLATPAQADSLSKMMQAMARFYVPAFNRRHGLTGALWQGRFRAAPVGGEATLLSCMLYVEQLPQRSGWDGPPSNFEWSSAAHHLGMCVHPWLGRIPSASAYWRLGNTPFERDAAYAKLLEQPVAADAARQIQTGALRGWAVGPGEFLAVVEAMTDRRLAPRQRGRPRRKDAVDVSLINTNEINLKI